MPVIELDISVKHGLVVRAGEMLKIPAHVKGRPKPSLTWTKDDGALDKKHAEVEEVGQDSTVIIKTSKRSDSGKYQITAANPSGIKSAWTTAEVVGEKNYILLSSYLPNGALFGQVLLLYWLLTIIYIFFF